MIKKSTGTSYANTDIKEKLLWIKCLCGGWQRCRRKVGQVSFQQRSHCVGQMSCKCQLCDTCFINHSISWSGNMKKRRVLHASVVMMFAAKWMRWGLKKTKIKIKKKIKERRDKYRFTGNSRKRSIYTHNILTHTSINYLQGPNIGTIGLVESAETVWTRPVLEQTELSVCGVTRVRYGEGIDNNLGTHWIIPTEMTKPDSQPTNQPASELQSLLHHHQFLSPAVLLCSYNQAFHYYDDYYLSSLPCLLHHHPHHHHHQHHHLQGMWQ